MNKVKTINTCFVVLKSLYHLFQFLAKLFSYQDYQTDRQTDTFIEPICYRFLIETNMMKGKETLTKTLQSLS